MHNSVISYLILHVLCVVVFISLRTLDVGVVHVYPQVCMFVMCLFILTELKTVIGLAVTLVSM